MNLFRSEEHIARWLGARAPGATVPVQTLCDLAHAWWDTRLHPDWRPRTRDENQAILDRLGLVGSFWALPETVLERHSRTLGQASTTYQMID